MTTAPTPFDHGQILPGDYDDVHRRRRGVRSKRHHQKFEAAQREVGELTRIFPAGEPEPRRGFAQGRKTRGHRKTPRRRSVARRADENGRSESAPEGAARTTTSAGP
jgi:hypothetical protein